MNKTKQIEIFLKRWMKYIGKMKYIGEIKFIVEAIKLGLEAILGIIHNREKYNTMVANVSKNGINFPVSTKLVNKVIVIGILKGARLEDVIKISTFFYKDGLRDKKLLNAVNRTIDIQSVFHTSISDSIKIEKTHSNEELYHMLNRRETKGTSIEEGEAKSKKYYKEEYQKRVKKELLRPNRLNNSIENLEFRLILPLSENKNYIRMAKAFPLIYNDNNPKIYAKKQLAQHAKLTKRVFPTSSDPKIYVEKLQAQYDKFYKSVFPTSLTKDLSLPNINLMKDFSLPNTNLVGDIISNDINKMETMMSSLPKISSYLGGYNFPPIDTINRNTTNNYNKDISIEINIPGNSHNNRSGNNKTSIATINSIQGTSFID